MYYVDRPKTNRGVVVHLKIKSEICTVCIQICQKKRQKTKTKGKKKKCEPVNKLLLARMGEAGRCKARRHQVSDEV
jgi:hypothetical protein